MPRAVQYHGVVELVGDIANEVDQDQNRKRNPEGHLRRDQPEQCVVEADPCYQHVYGDDRSLKWDGQPEQEDVEEDAHDPASDPGYNVCSQEGYEDYERHGYNRHEDAVYEVQPDAIVDYGPVILQGGMRRRKPKTTVQEPCRAPQAGRKHVVDRIEGHHQPEYPEDHRRDLPPRPPAP